MPLGNMGDKMGAFGWSVSDIDGHNMDQLLNAFAVSAVCQPHMIIANTVKGKGISFMEHVREWHHGTLTQQQYHIAVLELEAGGAN